MPPAQLYIRFSLWIFLSTILLIFAILSSSFSPSCKNNTKTILKMGYSTQIQSKFAHKVGEPVPEFNSEYVSPPV